MKKICNVALIILTLFGCVLFSACGDKYKSLEMWFTYPDGNPVEIVELVLDADDETKGEMELQVVLSGIKAKDVGELKVTSYPVVVVEDFQINDLVCSFKIKAHMVGVGKLNVTHLSSGKSVSVDLHVGQKTKSVSAKNINYIISIPDAGFNDHIISTENLVEFDSESCTDDVYFKTNYIVVSDDVVKPIYKTVNEEELIIGFSVSSNAVNLSSLEVYLVLNHKGYEKNEEFESEKIKITFIKKLQDTNVILTVDKSYALYKDAVEIDKQVNLLYNDNSTYEYNLNYYNANALKLSIVPDVNDDVLNSSYSYYQYDFECSDSDALGFEDIGNNVILVYSCKYTTNYVDATVVLKAKDCIGDIQEIRKTIKIKCDLKPTDIAIYKQDSQIEDITNTIDIYNYYAYGGTSLGAKFRFVPQDGSARDDLKTMRIEIVPEILNAKLGATGFNPVYDEDLNPIDTSEVLGKNQFVLQFCWANGSPLSFYKTQKDGQDVFVSEFVSDVKNVYIKYVEKTGNDNIKALSIDITTLSTSTIEYLKNINPVTTTLKFNQVDGVQSIKVNAGELIHNGNYEQDLYKDYGGDEIDVQSLYLDRKQGVDNADVPAYLLTLSDVMGLQGELTSSKFEITVSGIEDANALRLVQYQTSYKAAKGVDVINDSTSVLDEYTYSNNVEVIVNNSIILVFTENTPIGSYTITISHDSNENPLRVINCIVYEKSDVTDFGYNLETTEYSFKNEKVVNGEVSKLYNDYDADYIVAAGLQDLNLRVTIDDDVRESQLITGLIFSAKFDNGDNCDEYVEFLNNEGESVDLRFKKGTYIGENRYITISIQFYEISYSNIVTMLTSPVPLDPITFDVFVYEKINSDDVIIDQPSANVYIYDEYADLRLGYHYINKSKLELNISLSDENLKHYIQKQDGYYVKWSNNGQEDFDSINQEEREDYYIKYSFGKYKGTAYELTIFAEIEQFGIKYEKFCKVLAKNPVLTNLLVVDSPVDVDKYGNLSINLKKGGSYQIDATNYNTSGQEVSNPEYILAVVDTFDKVNNDVIYVVDNKIFASSQIAIRNGFRLFVIAKDCLKQEIKEGSTGLGLMSNYMMGSLSDYKNAYVVIDLIVSDGTETNPYIINSADDIWELNKNTSLCDEGTYFRIDNDIDMSSYTIDESFVKAISDFKGVIKTKNNQVMNITGLTLTDNMQNLFTQFSGSLSNVNFEVNYAYAGGGSNIGVIGHNTSTATLTNVTVEYEGTANISSVSNFGGLVGFNEGTISYADYGESVGANGKITITGGGQINFGGLVGKNTGNIIGYDYTTELVEPGDIQFIVVMGKQGSMANVDITSYNNNLSSAIGGVVGLNTTNDTNNGTIRYAVVTGTITAKDNNNVGGVIGKNTTTVVQAYVTVTGDKMTGIEIDTAYVEYCKSSVVITSANQNVGGVVGCDEGGSYKDCHYQITSSTTTAINAMENVGGIAGMSKNGLFNYCSVMSYRWDYADIANTFKITNTSNKPADIVSSGYVGGIVGCSISEYVPVASGITTGNYKAVVINVCSVNAYIMSNSLNFGSLGGLIVNNGGESIILDAYYLGKIEGRTYKTTGNLYIANNDNCTINNVYTVVNLDNDVKTGETEGLPKATHNYWGQTNDINGGYLFVTRYQDDVPLYELAPSKIEVKVNKDIDNYIADNTIYFDFYDFILDTTAEYYVNTFNALQQEYNTYDLKLVDDGFGNKTNTLFNYSYLPETLQNVRLNIVSLDTSVIKVLTNGVIQIKGVGDTTLVFSSVVNPAITCPVKVVVKEPIGNVIISTSGIDASLKLDDSNPLQIAKGSAKQLYLVSSGFKSYMGNDYYYRTNQTLDLDIELTSGVTLPTGNNFNDYIKISGQDLQTGACVVGYDNPFIVSVEELLPNYLDINSYVEFSVTPTFRPLSDLDEYINGSEIIFKLYTREGAKNLTLSYNSALVYPNLDTEISTYVETDMEINNISSAMANVKSVKILDENNTVIQTLTTLSEIQKYVSIKLSNIGELEQNVQTLIYNVDFSLFEGIKTVRSVVVSFGLTGYSDKQVCYTILPQKIDNIDVKNYVYESDDKNSFIEINVLKQIGQGLIIIDMEPDNGYYDYLEITDITGNQPIVFTQIQDTKGTRLDTMDEISSDGAGIKLKKLDDSGRTYVSTMVNKDFSSMTHTIKVSAFLNGGGFITSKKLQVNVQMLPTIGVQYLTSTGQQIAEEKSITPNATAKFIEGKAQYLAQGTTHRFRVYTQNASEGATLETLTIGGSDYKSSGVWKYVGDDYYELRLPQNVDLKGQEVVIKLSTKARYSNDDFETSDITLKFTVVEFVIYNVSAIHTTDSAREVIYGNCGVDTNIEFYFREGDIAYNGVVEDNEKIMAILEKLNTGELLSLYHDEDQDANIKTITLNGETVASLSENVLRVDKKYDNMSLNVNFKLKLNEDKQWILCTEDESLTYNQSFDLDFNERKSLQDMQLIRNEEEFLSMSSGDGTFYILGADLTFDENTTPFTPLDIDIDMFDGNGHTITIQRFTNFTTENIQAGLFKQINANMVVANVHVIYNLGVRNQARENTEFYIESYYDLCNQTEKEAIVQFSSATFGGITAINNGIITNCKVSGLLALETSYLEINRIGSDRKIPFYIGGIAGNNNGYITNSTSAAQIFAQANIGGVVYSNTNKIVSCDFDGTSDNGIIYAYKIGLTNQIIVDVAGFVVTNNGQISMSQVAVGTSKLKSNTLGNVSSRNPLAGFVYTNNGSIYDSLVDLEKIGQNQSYLYGFAANNSGGSIAHCYSFINGGQKAASIDMFVPAAHAGTIINCIEIMNPIAGYVNGVENLVTFKITNDGTSKIYAMEEYQKLGFVFGDNQNGAVFYMPSGQLPKLVAIKEQVKFDAYNAPTDVEGYKKYSGLREIREYTENVYDEATRQNHIKITTKMIEMSYGTKDNPYIVYDLASWDWYFSDQSKYYYNIVADIDFSSVYNGITTSNYVFSGNIQGNNMILSGIRLSSEIGLESVGLFKKLVSAGDRNIVNSVRNLTLQPIKVTATKTKMVGTLAGMAQDFNLYNITVDSSNLTVIGGNAVGGVVGLVRGNFDIDKVSSNVGANSTREIAGATYSIYMSVPNGKEKSVNIANVYYSGSVFAILDGYKTTTMVDNIRHVDALSYVKARNLSASGTFSVLGETVGGAVGFVGENVIVDNAKVIMSGELVGEQYSAGIAGENRGIIKNSTFTAESETIFNRAKYVCAGIVGLNLGGLVTDSNVKNMIVNKTGTTVTVGGIVGRNFAGTVANSSFDGQMIAYFTGGIIGAEYSSAMLKNRITGSGALVYECREIIPNSVTYKQYDIDEHEEEPINHLTNVSISVATFNFWKQNLSQFYTYKLKQDNTGYEVNSSSKVLGLVVGITDKDISIDTVELTLNLVLFNGENAAESGYIDDADINKKHILYRSSFGDIAKTPIQNGTEINADGEEVPVYEYYQFANTEGNYYLVGSKISEFDTWARKSYSDLMFIENLTNP